MWPSYNKKLNEICLWNPWDIQVKYTELMKHPITTSVIQEKIILQQSTSLYQKEILNVSSFHYFDDNESAFNERFCVFTIFKPDFVGWYTVYARWPF